MFGLVVKRGMLEICSTADCSILNIPVEILFARVRRFLAEIFETTRFEAALRLSRLVTVPLNRLSC